MEINEKKEVWGRAIYFWLAAAVVLIFLISLLHDILLPFVLGLVIAYFLDPIADRLEEIGLSRLFATIVIVALFSLLTVAILFILIPTLVNQWTAFSSKIPGYIQTLRELSNHYNQEWFGDLFVDKRLGFDQAFDSFGKQIADWGGHAIRGIVSGSLIFVSFLSLILITPVVTFYMLKDWDHIVASIDKMLPRDHAPTLRRLAREIDDMMAGFMRGQVTVLALLGLFYMIALHLSGLNFGILIGLCAGLLSFIPFVGALVGLLLSGSVAIVQFWPDWSSIWIVFAIFFAGQIIEGNILSPLIIGDHIRLHPVWLIFSLFVFGYLFGFFGLLIAIPCAAALGVVVRFSFQKYKESKIYQGKDTQMIRD